MNEVIFVGNSSLDQIKNILARKKVPYYSAENPLELQNLVRTIHFDLIFFLVTIDNKTNKLMLSKLKALNKNAIICCCLQDYRFSSYLLGLENYFDEKITLSDSQEIHNIIEEFLNSNTSTNSKQIKEKINEIINKCNDKLLLKELLKLQKMIDK